MKGGKGTRRKSRTMVKTSRIKNRKKETCGGEEMGNEEEEEQEGKNKNIERSRI